uniref:Trehalase n=1 Tax=Suricata suricatta TaxID=37032 RepID=A0A673VR41_SURSU
MCAHTCTGVLTQPWSGPGNVPTLQPCFSPNGGGLTCVPPDTLCSQIYCHGELLHQVQMAKLFQDDKQFVDMPLSTTPDQVLQHFRELAASHNDSIPRPLLHAFVQEHFRGVGQELEPWTPADWKDSPRFLQKIADPKLRVWGEQLHQLWKKLGKKVSLSWVLAGDQAGGQACPLEAHLAVRAQSGTHFVR